jgi:hypothetical protein
MVPLQRRPPAQAGLARQRPLPTGQKGVRIELHLDDKEVLLSDFGKWHYVLNNWFLARDGGGDEQFDRAKNKVGYKRDGRFPEPLQSKVVASWERIFDLTTLEHDWLGRFHARMIQATFWELRFKDVTDVTFFTAR